MILQNTPQYLAQHWAHNRSSTDIYWPTDKSVTVISGSRQPRVTLRLWKSVYTLQLWERWSKKGGDHRRCNLHRQRQVGAAPGFLPSSPAHKIAFIREIAKEPCEREMLLRGKEKRKEICERLEESRPPARPFSAGLSWAFRVQCGLWATKEGAQGRAWNCC